MTVAELDAQAQALRAEGLTYREIGERMGRTTSGAWARCNRPIREPRSCQGCGADITATHGHRKWCSDYCRKQTLYGVTCTTCGQQNYGGNGKVEGDEYTCQDCRADESERAAKPVLAAWAEGQPEWHIAQEQSLRPTQVRGIIQYARRRGVPVELHRRRNREAWPEIERRYHAGETYAEIGEAIDASGSGVSQMVERMRAAGYDLPRRAA